MEFMDNLQRVFSRLPFAASVVQQILGVSNGLCDSMRAARLFLRARAMIKYVLRAASTLKSTDGEQRALLKFSRRNLISLY